MKCSKCGKQKSLKEVQFKRNGTLPGTSLPKYDTVCNECSRAVAIDDTSK